MPVGYNCRHCGDSPKKGKRKKFPRIFKRRNQTQVYDLVKNWVLLFAQEVKVCSAGFRKEKVSVDLQLKEHEVEKILQMLNVEGLVSQPIHKAPHDSTRDKWTWGGGDSSWQGDLYYLTEKCLARKQNDGTI